MATWTNVSSTVLEPGDPIRSVDIIAIKENIIALSEGASGAPQIQTAAITSLERMNTTNVLAATAGASVGAVGTYAFLIRTSGSGTISPGSTFAGSSLGYQGGPILRNHSGNIYRFSGTAAPNIGTGGSPSGTWRCMGYAPFVSYTSGDDTIEYSAGTLFLRIS